MILCVALWRRLIFIWRAVASATLTLGKLEPLVTAVYDLSIALIAIVMLTVVWRYERNPFVPEAQTKSC
jgi:hypothetical protein